MEQIKFRDEGNKTFFSCGCVTEVIGKNYVMVPCSPNCEVYLYAIEQSNRKGNVISYQISKEAK